MGGFTIAECPPPARDDIPDLSTLTTYLLIDTTDPSLDLRYQRMKRLFAMCVECFDTHTHSLSMCAIIMYLAVLRKMRTCSDTLCAKTRSSLCSSSLLSPPHSANVYTRNFTLEVKDDEHVCARSGAGPTGISCIRGPSLFTVRKQHDHLIMDVSFVPCPNPGAGCRRRSSTRSRRPRVPSLLPTRGSCLTASGSTGIQCADSFRCV